MWGRRKAWRIVLEDLPVDVRYALEAAIDGDEVLLISDGKELGRVSVEETVLSGVVIPAPDEPQLTTEVPLREGVTVVATAMRLSRKARARLSEELGEDYVVLDLNEAPDSAEVVLIPAVSPTLVGMLRSRFRSARILVTEIEDEELGAHYTGPVTRILDAGATAYLPPRSISGIAEGLHAFLTTSQAPAITAGDAGSDTQRPRQLDH